MEVEGKTAMDLYVTLLPPAGSLRVRSSSDGLGSAANYANRQPRFPDAGLPFDFLLIFSIILIPLVIILLI